MRLFFFGLILSVSLTPHAYGATLEEVDLARLSEIPAKYEVFGTICEYLTMLRLEEDYPQDEFTIEVGIEYVQRGRTIGEIDVVVFRNDDMQAILVGQVKCSSNMNSARRKADEQNRRFLNTLYRASAPISYRSTSDRSLIIFPWQMETVEEAITASQNGGEDYGFDLTIGHSLSTVVEMREELLFCQSQGRCPRPEKTLHDVSSR